MNPDDTLPHLCTACLACSPTPDDVCPGSPDFDPYSLTGSLHDRYLVPVRTLDMKPIARYADGSPIYSFAVGFPTNGVRVMTDSAPRPEQAFQQGMQFATEYERRDPLGNFAKTLGVTFTPDGYRAVVVTYHSNS